MRRLLRVLAFTPVLALAGCPWADGSSWLDGVPPAHSVIVLPLPAGRG